MKKRSKNTPFLKHLNKREHNEYDFDGRAKYLISTTFWFFALLIILFILYSNLSKLNEKSFFYLQLGGILFLADLFFVIKYGIRFFKELWNILKRQKNWIIYLIGLIFFILLLVAFFNKETILESPINTISSLHISEISPISFNFSLTSTNSSFVKSNSIQKETSSNSAGLKSMGIINQSKLPKTIFFLVLIWGAYYYFKNKKRFIQRNKNLVLLVLFSISLILISNHVSVSSEIGELFDWVLFLAVSATSIFGAFLGIRWVNSWNLANDMNLWGLRLLGLLLAFVGFIVLTAGSFASVFVSLSYGKNLVSSWVPWIVGLSLIFWAAFCEFRSTRRYPVIGIWQA